MAAVRQVSPLSDSFAAPEIEIVEATYKGKDRSGTDISFGPVSLKVGSGEFFSILGSTVTHGEILLRMIAGLDYATSGEVRVSGKRVGSVQGCAGMVFREPSLLAWRTGLENVLLGCEARGLDPVQAKARARHLLAAMGASQCADLKPPVYSPSLAQRVSICRALAPEPALLLMGDFFCGLDGLDREQMVADFQRLWLTPKITVVLCTTAIGEAVRLSDHVAVMGTDGRLLQVVSIDLPRPRRMDKATTPRIAEYGSCVRTILHAAGILS